MYKKSIFCIVKMILILLLLATQVFAFVLNCNASVWGKFNWSKLSTIAIVGFYESDLVCHAHHHGVRVVKLGKDFRLH